MKNTDRISVTLLVKDAESTIEQCLTELSAFGEVVVLDNGSTDSTLSIMSDFAQKHGNTNVYHTEFLGFGAMKQLAVSHAQNDWILSIDADEILLPETIDKINQIELSDNTIISLSRINYYDGKQIKGCSWYPDYVERVFNRKHTNFNDKKVHEGVIIPSDSRVIKIADAMKHYTSSDIDTLVHKMNKYSTYAADIKHKQGRGASICGAIVRFHITFVKNYVFQSGWRLGYRGFAISVVNACDSFFRYLKLYEMNKQEALNKKER